MHASAVSLSTPSTFPTHLPAFRPIRTLRICAQNICLFDTKMARGIGMQWSLWGRKSGQLQLCAGHRYPSAAKGSSEQMFDVPRGPFSSERIFHVGIYWHEYTGRPVANTSTGARANQTRTEYTLSVCNKYSETCEGRDVEQITIILISVTADNVPRITNSQVLRQVGPTISVSLGCV